MVSLRLVTPGMGTLALSKESEPELFALAKLGLGALGVVSQVRPLLRPAPPSPGGSLPGPGPGQGQNTALFSGAQRCVAAGRITTARLCCVGRRGCAQVTLQCVPRHRLVERTFTTTMADVKRNHVT